MKRSHFDQSLLFTVSAFTIFAACADIEENPDAASVGTASSPLVGVMSFGYCTAAEITKLNAAVAVLVEITGTQYTAGFRYPAYEACLSSAAFVENGSWSGAQIANQLRTNKVTGIWCVDLASNIIAQAWEKPNYDEEVYFNKDFIATLPSSQIAATIGHELMHNRGFKHSVNDSGSPLYPNTVPEQVEACILNGAPNPMPFTPNPNTHGDDLALFGGAGWTTLPVAFSNDDGSFAVSNGFVGDFGGWANSPGVQRVSGDFNGDGRMDIALTGGAGWTTIPVAMSLGNGGFTVTNAYVGDFGAWANTPGAKALTGDFNKDGYTDIALTGPAWRSIPVAFSAGGGSFTVTNAYVGDFGAWANTPGAKALTGDFNKDGYTDIALTGPAWSSIPVAFSAGGGSFTVTNAYVGDFGAWSNTPGARAIAGDFNGDGYTDIALTGGPWSSLPVAFSAGGGAFNVTNKTVTSFPGLSTNSAASAVAGRLN